MVKDAWEFYNLVLAWSSLAIQIPSGLRKLEANCLVDERAHIMIGFFQVSLIWWRPAPVMMIMMIVVLLEEIRAI